MSHVELTASGGVRTIYLSLVRLVSEGIDTYLTGSSTFAPPPIALDDAREVCGSCLSLFEMEPALLDLKGDFTIIGDLHGHLVELIRVLSQFGCPPVTNYLILGDLVDRGPFSIHTTLFAFALKCCYPTSVYIIRGNHEFESVNKIGGLLKEVTDDYGSKDLFDAMNRTFSQLPIAVLLNSDLLLVHGGIGPNVKTLDQIRSVPKPLYELYGGVADALLWSDPTTSVPQFKDSTRGTGFDFGEDGLAAFLDANGLRILIRGHQAIQGGVEYSFHGRLVTVFGCSSYCGREKGSAGVLQVKDGSETLIDQRLDWIPYVERPSVRRIPLPDRPLGLAPPIPPGTKPPIVMIKAMKGKRSGYHTASGPTPKRLS
jgi:diadenosine tetraphosphatase ApaH/serine/threonine PP2A family protein phosphatase